MQPPYFAQMRQAISDARLDAYRASRSDREIDLLARYAWNMALSEALYPSLQALEVTLRNALHDAISARYSTRWFDDPAVLPTVNGRAMVQEATQKVARARRQPEAAVRAAADFPGRLVAAADLGFWTHLFNDPFEQGPGKPKPLWPGLIPNVFPHAPRFFREHRKLGRRLDAIRVFRNRVFHHEPISRDAATLASRHGEIVETLRWLNPAAWRTVQEADRFTTVYDCGVAFHAARLERFCRANGYLIS